jgi:SNF2 family DNA or RNA helicase
MLFLLAWRPMKYKFKLQPLKHQVKEYLHHIKRFHSATFSETGCGKTLPALAAAESRLAHGLAERVLYVAPAYLMDKIQSEIDKCIDSASVVLWNKDRKKRLELIAQAHETPFHIVNYEALMYYEEELCDVGYDMVIADEAHRAKNYRSSTSKALRKISKNSKYRLAATGTPLCREPEDVFGIFLFLDDSIFGRFITPFRDRFCKRESQNVGWGASARTFVKTVGFKDGVEEEFQRILKDVAITHKKEGNIDLPPKVEQERRVNMPDSIRRVYNELADDKCIQIPDGPLLQVTSPGVLHMKLGQLASGFLMHENGVWRVADSPKLSEVDDILQERMHKKTVIWCKYKESMRILCERYKHMNPVTQEGGGDHVSARRKFEHDDSCKLLISNLNINAGYELTVADAAIYYEIPFSYVDWKQSMDRIHRKGSEIHPQILYYILLVRNTVEVSARYALGLKKDLADVATSVDISKGNV